MRVHPNWVMFPHLGRSVFDEMLHGRPKVPLASDAQTATPYTDAVRAYARAPFVRLDVPGHGGVAQPELADVLGESALALDVPPLVAGIDQGPRPTPLQRSARLAAEAWGAHRTWLLTNGGSKGNLVACLALRHLGEEVVVQRSMHSSVIDGMVLGGLRGHFVAPEVDAELGAAHGLRAESLASALDECPSAIAAYIVTPSYFGAVADVRALAEVAHARGVPLVVDEAWGAHFGFHPTLPANALAQGADLVVSSTHKLGGSLTQSALLHLGPGKFRQRLEPLVNRAFRSLQSTSASSLLTLSLDVARSSLAVHGQQRIGQSLQAAEQLREGVRSGGRFRELSSRFLAAPGVVALDPLRVVIDTRHGGISGHEARQILFEHHQIHTEMASGSVIVAVIGAGAVPDVERALRAIHALPDHGAAATPAIALPDLGTAVVPVRDAYFAPAELVTSDRAVGRVSADSLAAYPPGIPNLLPGERITRPTVDFLQRTANSPFGHVRGAVDPGLTRLRVLVTTE
jgi:lysine decarboxylase